MTEKQFLDESGLTEVGQVVKKYYVNKEDIKDKLFTEEYKHKLDSINIEEILSMVQKQGGANLPTKECNREQIDDLKTNGIYIDPNVANGLFVVIVSDLMLDNSKLGIYQIIFTTSSQQGVSVRMRGLFNSSDNWTDSYTVSSTDIQSAIQKLEEQMKNLSNPSTSTVDIINDLTTGGTDKALSAEQGKILFQYANEGKEKIANALIGKGSKDVSKDSDFGSLAQAIKEIPTGYASGTILDNSKIQLFKELEITPCSPKITCNVKLLSFQNQLPHNYLYTTRGIDDKHQELLRIHKSDLQHKEHLSYEDFTSIATISDPPSLDDPTATPYIFVLTYGFLWIREGQIIRFDDDGHQLWEDFIGGTYILDVVQDRYITDNIYVVTKLTNKFAVTLFNTKERIKQIEIKKSSDEYYLISNQVNTRINLVSYCQNDSSAILKQYDINKRDLSVISSNDNTTKFEQVKNIFSTNNYVILITKSNGIDYNFQIFDNYLRLKCGSAVIYNNLYDMSIGHLIITPNNQCKIYNTYNNQINLIEPNQIEGIKATVDNWQTLPIQNWNVNSFMLYYQQNEPSKLQLFNWKIVDKYKVI